MVLFVVLGMKEFPPIWPLQFLLLCPIWPQLLHCLEIPALLPAGSPASLVIFFLGLPKWSFFYRRLNKLDTTGPSHILPIGRCNYWLITGLICGDMKTLMHILLSFLPIEEYAGNCMGTWYASRMPFPATTMSFFHVHSETLQSTFNLKLCMTCPISKPLVACNLFPMRSLKHFRTYLWFHSHDLLSVILKPGLKI